MKYTDDDLKQHPIWKHKVRGTLYHVIGVALCSTNGERNQKETSVIYFSISTQKLWYREIGEFLDGRFEPVTPEEQ